jgi:nicotinate-nucleotide adenylyltransferase
MRIGILGGTFDPPHNAHLAIACAALEQLDLARVLFVPARQPPHKPLDTIAASLEDRLAMVTRAIAGEPRLELSRADADRTGPNYTTDLLRALRGEYPDAELYFIMGGDSLADLPTWHAPRELIRLCHLAVAARPGWVPNLDALERQIPGLAARVVFIRAPALDISSSEIRDRVRADLPIDEMVPPAVAQYIRERNLYR